MGWMWVRKKKSKMISSFGPEQLGGPFAEMKKKEAGAGFGRRVRKLYSRHVKSKMFIKLSNRDVD